MEAVVVVDPPAAVAFDVQACWFAHLTAALARPDLAVVFCAADRVHFDDPANPVQLERHETLAAGDERCAFRLRFRERTAR